MLHGRAAHRGLGARSLAARRAAAPKPSLMVPLESPFPAPAPKPRSFCSLPAQSAPPPRILQPSHAILLSSSQHGHIGCRGRGSGQTWSHSPGHRGQDREQCQGSDFTSMQPPLLTELHARSPELHLSTTQANGPQLLPPPCPCPPTKN